jgi:sugar O-acyltransferase (sialic acid O-acetyltransferase NeuD family)
MDIKKVVLLGAGGFAAEVLEIILDEGRYIPLGFIVDPEFTPKERSIHGYPILGGFDWLEREGGEVGAVIAVSAPELKREFSVRCAGWGIELCSAIHPSVWVSRWAEVGRGVVICHDSILRNDSKVGNACTLNMVSIFGHGASLGDYSTLAIAVSITGECHIGEGVFLGSGVTFAKALKVGRWSRVGAGSVLIEDVPPNTTVVGNPGRVVRERKEGWQLELTT